MEAIVVVTGVLAGFLWGADTAVTASDGAAALLVAPSAAGANLCTVTGIC